MPKVDYYVPVDASLQTIWGVLLDRIENPARYLAGLESCEFPEGNEDYAIRELIINGLPLKERITIDERKGEVRYELLDHPLFAGDVYNALIPPDEADMRAKPIVQFRMDWRPLSPEAAALEAEAGESIRESLEQAVNYVRDLAEHMEKQRAAQ